MQVAQRGQGGGERGDLVAIDHRGLGEYQLAGVVVDAEHLGLCAVGPRAPRSVLPSAASTHRRSVTGPPAAWACAATASRRPNPQPVNAACSATGSSRDSSRRKVLACGGSAQTRTSCSVTAAQSAIAAYDRAPATTTPKAKKRIDRRL